MQSVNRKAPAQKNIPVGNLGWTPHKGFSWKQQIVSSEKESHTQKFTHPINSGLRSNQKNIGGCSCPVCAIRRPKNTNKITNTMGSVAVCKETANRSKQPPVDRGVRKRCIYQKANEGVKEAGLGVRINDREGCVHCGPKLIFIGGTFLCKQE